MLIFLGIVLLLAIFVGFPKWFYERGRYYPSGEISFVLFALLVLLLLERL
jgi:Protein of unknown function (DUF3309)